MKQFHYTIQTLIRDRRSCVIKVISLSLGLLVSIILFSRVAFELSYDNCFQDVDNLYIVKTEWIKDGVIKGNAGSISLCAIYFVSCIQVLFSIVQWYVLNRS